MGEEKTRRESVHPYTAWSTPYSPRESLSPSPFLPPFPQPPIEESIDTDRPGLERFPFGRPKKEKHAGGGMWSRQGLAIEPFDRDE